MTASRPERWQLRLASYEQALAGLDEAVALAAQRNLTELEKAGMVQRFELAWALGWKLLADRLTADLAPPENLTPGATIRAAYAAGLIDSAEQWIAAAKLRNQLSHTYSRQIRDNGLRLVEERFLTMMHKLRTSSRARIDD